MSDDLIKRLRLGLANPIVAADRIEQLERERDDFEIALDKTMSVLDTQTQFLFQARTNLESVQAKLAKAVEALRKIAHGGGYTDMQIARAVLAELEGKEDLKSKEDRLYGDERYTDHGRIED